MGERKIVRNLDILRRRGVVAGEWNPATDGLQQVETPKPLPEGGYSPDYGQPLGTRRTSSVNSTLSSDVGEQQVTSPQD